MSEPTVSHTHRGSCHCGAVRYEVEADLGGPLIACNCSMCGRSGTVLAFVGLDQFESVSGEDHLTSYQFNKHVIDHLFCKTCGIKPYARGQKPDGTKMIAVNVRCLEGVDVETLQVTHVDGKGH